MRMKILVKKKARKKSPKKRKKNNKKTINKINQEKGRLNRKFMGHNLKKNKN